MTANDDAARERIRNDLDATLVVEAAAGTGKTTALVGRILALITSGRARLSTLVAVTFTEKAAGEMKLRVRAEIENARRASRDDVKQRLEQALEELEVARIGTIHSFSADLLREHPVEAEVDPLFKVMSESEARQLYDLAFDQWFLETLSAPEEAVRRILRRKPNRFTTSSTDLLRSAGLSLIQNRDFDGAWRQDAFDRDRELTQLFDDIEALGALTEQAFDPEDWLTQSLATLHRFAQEVRVDERTRPRDLDDLEARLRQFRTERPANKWTWRGRNRLEFGEGILRDNVLEQRAALKARYDHVMDRCDADLAVKLKDALNPLIAAYEALKAKAGCLDFLDLMLKVRSLLMTNRAVREELKQRFTHLLIDEVQDTDPLQADVVCLLAADASSTGDPKTARVAPGKLFLVGDPKQSIYRFRRADVTFYESVKARLQKDGAELLHLSKSFRSDPRIQRFVNATFAPRMQGGHQANYVPLTPVRDPDTRRPAVVALPVPEPYGDYGKIVQWKVEASEPHAVGAWLDWLINASGWEVEDPVDGARVPIAPRHVCLLFRRFQSFGEAVTKSYTRALEARGIRHVLVGGRAFHEREEVIALTNALTAIEWPDDEMAVFATLKGPFIAIPDDLLLLWREGSPVAPNRKRRFHPLVPKDDALPPELAPVQEALSLLAELHRARNRRPFADTVHAFCEATRAHAGLALWHGGEQALGNVLRIGQLARKVEAEGATSFRSLLEVLKREAERGESPEASVVEEGTEGVRIMTVHRSKGLEFPVVILCDMTAAVTPGKPSRYTDQDRRVLAQPLAGCVPFELLEHADDVLARDAEESDRLLYVATTRARDVLVLPVVGDEPHDGWIGALNPTLYPRDRMRRAAGPAPGCPEFGHDSVAHRPNNAPGPDRSVRPGTHQPIADVPVVWWDPVLFNASIPTEGGLFGLTLLAESGLAEASVKAYDAWNARAARRRDTAVRPQHDVVNPTDDDVPSAPAAAIRFESTGHASKERPSGPRFGELVHAVLEVARCDDTPETIARLTNAHAESLNATEAERRAATDAVLAALAHPILLEAAASSDARKECPVLLTLDANKTVEGTIDLLYRNPARPGWTVIEFKTTFDVDRNKEAYERQVAWYMHAVSAATGEPVEGVVLQL